MAPPPDGGAGGRIGAPRIGGTRSGSGVTASTPRLDAAEKWLTEISGLHTVDLGGISELSQKKITYGLEKYGRPVLRVTPYMVARAITAAQRYTRSTRSPTKATFWNTVDAEVLGVVIERIANAGGDLAAVWAAHPLTAEYRKAKQKKYPGKPMGQASGALLRDVRSTQAFAATKRR